MNYFSGEIWELVKKVYRERNLAITVLNHPTDAIEKGNGWIVNYDFDLVAGATAYLAFETGDKHIHVRSRSLNIVDLSNQVIVLRTETLAAATIDTLGTDISENVINANLNIADNIDVTMYDETTTVTAEGSRIPFTKTISGDRKQAGATVISDEYILELNGLIVLKFVNEGIGNVRIEYNSNGYQE